MAWEIEKKKCVRCGKEFEGLNRRYYCSEECRQEAYKERKHREYTRRKDKQRDDYEAELRRKEFRKTPEWAMNYAERQKAETLRMIGKICEK